jgi:glycosyltransferase involved in cell wall biosynthesis
VDNGKSMMNAKISVIIPIYKVEKYLSNCVESVLNQTYSNLEIILVDDGSPDRCGEICDQFAARDSRIRVIHKPNGGHSDARNAGLEVATCEYVSFIDSDDFIHERFYETLLYLADRNEADIVQCDFIRISWQEVAKINSHDPDRFVQDQMVTVLSNHEALHNLFTYDHRYVSTVVAWNKLYKRELFDSIRYPLGKIHEDEYTTYKLLHNSRKIVLTSAPMYFYLQRDDSSMGIFNFKRLDILEAYYEQIHFYKERGYLDLERKAKISYEGRIRELMLRVLNSRLDDKNAVYKYLIDYYRQQYGLFASNTDVPQWKKLMMLLYKYSSKSVIKLMLKLKYYKDLIT